MEVGGMYILDGLSTNKRPKILAKVRFWGLRISSGLIHQLSPTRRASTTTHSVRTVARLSIVICHQVPVLLAISSAIHHIISPTPSMGAMKLQKKVCSFTVE